MGINCFELHVSSKVTVMALHQAKPLWPVSGTHLSYVYSHFFLFCCRI